ncbi:DUF2254 domain-containing protein [Maribacter sp. ACAM166]|uniref:DUF2254 domain-containing protein n=1 Tax=Maribacter sp. ACAM166 TaxID=2508996 RepID=UPI0010FE9DF1|nr:DUF2254 domain-containing protein [Maribacter sp. ACAM166]TLP80396.1 DUF2254 domain-containing protein [Maribacter sp. ACAM166]
MNRITNFFYKIRSKIAFFPSVISFAGLMLAFFMIYLEQIDVSAYLMDVAPGLVIDNTDTAKTLLSTLIGGLISLTVFSFSMVMVLLNQASSNFSPRVLPGIISNQKHQVVLGQYIATILYNIFILVSIEPTENKYQTPGFSVLIGIILTVLCLASFIYFIHNISQAIQVGNILTNIHKKTKTAIVSIIKEQKENSFDFPQTEHWEKYTVNRVGYFYGILKDNLIDICKQQETKVTIELFKGQFILDGTVGIISEKPLSKKVEIEIMETLLFSREELVGENYIYGFRQISEIGVKAMSPGINDPGTALNTIDYLTSLFLVLMKKSDFEYIHDKEGTNWARIKCVKFSEVLYNVMATYRQYCKHDITVMRKLMHMLHTLTSHVINSNQMKDIEIEIEQLNIDAKIGIENKRDLSKIDVDFISWS